MHTFYAWQGDDLLLRVKAQAKASKDEFAEVLDNRLKIRITAPPIDGKANQHLIKFLSGQFKVSKSQIELLTGDGAREKRFMIRSPKQLPAIIPGPEN
jgi:uncharacterized protein